MVFPVLPQRPKGPLLGPNLCFNLLVECASQVLVPTGDGLRGSATQFSNTQQEDLHVIHESLLLETRVLTGFHASILPGNPFPRRTVRCFADRPCELVPDATGVGRPVVDMLRQADLGCTISPVLITGGDAETNRDGYYGVPKRDLIVGMQVLPQGGGLRIAEGLAEGPQLVREMAEMRVKVTSGGREQYAAWREGEHDDLVFAVALACWAARRRYPHAPAGEDGWWRRTNTAEWEGCCAAAVRSLPLF